MNAYIEEATNKWVLVPADGYLLYNAEQNIYTSKLYTQDRNVTATDWVEVTEGLVTKTDDELMSEFADDIKAYVKIVRGTKKMTSTKVSYSIGISLTDTSTPIHITETYK